MPKEMAVSDAVGVQVVVQLASPNLLPADHIDEMLHVIGGVFLLTSMCRRYRHQAAHLSPSRAGRATKCSGGAASVV